MRIYLFSGLKGVDINRRYIRLVRQRILTTIVNEARAELSLPDSAPNDPEVEFAWTIHGGIFYYGVRNLIYESPVATHKTQVIEDAVDALLLGLRKKLTGE